MSHLSTSFSNVRRAPFQAMAAVSVLAITFFVMSLLAIVVYGSEQTLRYFESRPQVIAFLIQDATDADIDSLSVKLQGDTRVRDVTVVTQEEAFEIYKEATSDNPLLGELVSPSIFPASVEFSAVDLTYADELIKEVSQESYVDSVGFTASLGSESEIGDVISRLTTISETVRTAGVVAVGVLAFTSFLVLTVVVSMRIMMRKAEIDILSLIGASAWFIRAPIVFEALIYAFIGVTLGWLGSAVLVMYASPSIFTYFTEIEVIPKDSTTFFVLLVVLWAIELAVGSVIAFFGSMFSVGRSIRSVR